MFNIPSEQPDLALDALHVTIVLSPFILVPVAGWLGARGIRARLLGFVPATLTCYFAWTFWLVSANGPFRVTVPWAPSLGLSLSFHFDGLGVLFATLIAAVGTLIVVYAADYLKEHADAGKFQIFLFAFMGSMLGLVLADNLIALFVFWELTGFTSYLLIGFEHERPEARGAALQALLVTGAGGLALLAAGILLWQAGGTTSLSEMLGGGLNFVGRPTYVGIVALILLAAFTKSAQFPFHFWLPNAMQAPTPVSAYLHSATMVKAGVYLVARMTPLVGGTALWTYSLTVAGVLTMIGGSYRAVVETDLKRILAYSTISALGFLMLLLGVGTPQAVIAALVYLLAHACYKGGLFLVAGAVEHENGTRDVRVLAGLRRAMPRTALAAMLAAASMAGFPLFFGFIAKEQVYESVGTSTFIGLWPEIVVTAAVVASILQGAAALITGVSPFLGPTDRPGNGHEAPGLLWLCPLVLGVTGLVLGVVPAIVDAPVGLAAASVVRNPVPVNLAIWHGVSATLIAQRCDAWLAPSACSSTVSGCAAFSGLDPLGRSGFTPYRWPVSTRSADGRTCAPKRLAALIRADSCSDGRCVRRDGACDRRPSAHLETLDTDRTLRRRGCRAHCRSRSVGGMRALEHDRGAVAWCGWVRSGAHLRVVWGS